MICAGFNDQSKPLAFVLMSAEQSLNPKLTFGSRSPKTCDSFEIRKNFFSNEKKEVTFTFEYKVLNELVTQQPRATTTTTTSTTTAATTTAATLITMM